MTESWLKCETTEGIFPFEAYAKANTSNGASFSLFVDKHLLKNPEVLGQNLLRVQVLNQTNGISFVCLPKDPFETGNVVPVDSNQLEEIAS